MRAGPETEGHDDAVCVDHALADRVDHLLARLHGEKTFDDGDHPELIDPRSLNHWDSAKNIVDLSNSDGFAKDFKASCYRIDGLLIP